MRRSRNLLPKCKPISSLLLAEFLDVIPISDASPFWRQVSDVGTDIEFDIDENGEFREYQVVSNPVSSITSPQNSIHNHPEGDERYLKLLEQYNRVVEDRNKIVEDRNKIVEERNIIEENNKRLVKSHDKLLKSRNRLKVKYHRLQKKMKRASKNAIVDIFTRGRQSRRYSSEIRSFALTQSFLSQRSYTSLREKSGKQLPHPRTIRKWYRAVTTEPGLSVAAIRAINLKVEEDRKNGKETTFAALIMDEVSIRRRAIWDPNTKNFLGYEDFGLKEVQNKKKLAKEALVYMVSAINGRWKIPVAYFLSSGVTGKQKADLTNTVLSFLCEAKIKVISFTFDGHKTNTTMMQILNGGETFGDPGSNHFPHPDLKHNIYFLLDGCHMLKLMRNYVATPRLLLDAEGRGIEWEYIEKLHKKQKEIGLHFGNKLRERHIRWRDNKMNVKIAVQTLSDSTANSIDFARELEISGFEDSEGTTEYLRMMNKVKADVAEIEQYLRSLDLCIFDSEGNVEMKKLWDSSLNTGPRGIVMSLTSLINIYDEYVGHGLKYVAAYKFSQDHLETFFSQIRSHGGFNNNPNASQFCGAYRKLLHMNEIRASNRGNCEEDTGTSILWVSSSTKDCRLLDRTILPPIEPSEYIELEDIILPIIVYIAGYVEHALLDSRLCTECKSHLENYSRTSDLRLIEKKDRGGLCIPSDFTVKLCEVAEISIRSHQLCADAGLQIEHTFKTLSAALENIKRPDAENCICRQSLTEKIFETYLSTRMRHESTKLLGPSIRQKLKAIINASGD
ncbi:hypothetical protein DMENIID0001_025510 [Sergentomyia squamirostris]